MPIEAEKERRDSTFPFGAKFTRPPKGLPFE